MSRTERPGPVHIVGAGPGVGLATARRFADARHPLGLVARNRGQLEMLEGTLRREGHDVEVAVADIKDPSQLRAALNALRQAQGTPAVLCFSPHPDVDLIKPVLETTAEDVRDALALVSVGAVTAATAVLPHMRRAQAGTLLFVTGSAVESPSPARAVSAVAGLAEKTYVEFLAAALAGSPVHVAHLVVVGAVGAGKKHEPDAVAQRLWELHTSRRDSYAVMR